MEKKGIYDIQHGRDRHPRWSRGVQRPPHAAMITSALNKASRTG